MPQKALDAPFVFLQRVVNVIAIFMNKMIQKSAKFATSALTLLK